MKQEMKIKFSRSQFKQLMFLINIGADTHLNALSKELGSLKDIDFQNDRLQGLSASDVQNDRDSITAKIHDVEREIRQVMDLKKAFDNISEEGVVKWLE